jgi:S1-C subfamily serine protease
MVHFHDGSSHEAVAVAIDADLDLAVIRVSRRRVAALTPKVAVALPGSPVIAMARASASGDWSAQVGVVTCRGVSLRGRLDPANFLDYGHLIESTTKIEPGYSGGPLLDAGGTLVGLNVAAAGIRDDDRWRGYAIPFDARTVARVARLSARARAPHPLAP